jgi:hypothetical protein
VEDEMSWRCGNNRAQAFYLYKSYRLLQVHAKIGMK